MKTTRSRRILPPKHVAHGLFLPVKVARIERPDRRRAWRGCRRRGCRRVEQRRVVLIDRSARRGHRRRRRRGRRCRAGGRAWCHGRHFRRGRRCAEHERRADFQCRIGASCHQRNVLVVYCCGVASFDGFRFRLVTQDDDVLKCWKSACGSMTTYCLLPSMPRVDSRTVPIGMPLGKEKPTPGSDHLITRTRQGVIRQIVHAAERRAVHAERTADDALIAAGLNHAGNRSVGVDNRADGAGRVVHGFGETDECAGNCDRHVRLHPVAAALVDREHGEIGAPVRGQSPAPSADSCSR